MHTTLFTGNGPGKLQSREDVLREPGRPVLRNVGNLTRQAVGGGTHGRPQERGQALPLDERPLRRPAQLVEPVDQGMIVKAGAQIGIVIEVMKTLGRRVFNQDFKDMKFGEQAQSREAGRRRCSGLTRRLQFFPGVTVQVVPVS
jgi:hypothetical protein